MNQLHTKLAQRSKCFEKLIHKHYRQRSSQKDSEHVSSSLSEVHKLQSKKMKHEHVEIGHAILIHNKEVEPCLEKRKIARLKKQDRYHQIHSKG